MKNQLKLHFPFFLLLFTFSLNTNAQSWERTFEQPGTLAKGFDVVEATDGGYVMCGEVDLPTGAIRHHIWAVKTDIDGNELWSRIYHYGGVGADEAKGLVETADGGFMITGRSLENQIQVMKISADGDSLWTKSYPIGGSPVTEAIIVKPDGSGYLIVGGRESDPSIDVTAFTLVSLDNDGEMLWENSFESTQGFGSKAMDIKPTSNGEFIIVGIVQGSGCGLIRVDDTGEQLWAKNYTITSGDRGFSVEEMTNGEILLGGRSTGFAGFNPLLLHLDANGEMMTNQPIISTISLGAVSDIEKTTDGGYILTGSGFSFWNGIDAEAGYILKLNENLEVQWDSLLKDATTQGTAIIQTSDGGFVMSGFEGGNMFMKKIGGMTNSNKELLSGHNWQVGVYPNPTTTNLTFEFSSKQLQSDLLQIELYSPDGKQLKSQEVNELNEVMNVEALKAGNYSYLIRSGGVIVNTGFVVIM